MVDHSNSAVRIALFAQTALRSMSSAQNPSSKGHLVCTAEMPENAKRTAACRLLCTRYMLLPLRYL